MDCRENYSTQSPLSNKQRCVPRCYKEVGKILQEVKSCKGNLKTVLYKTRHKGSFFQKIYSLSANILKYKLVLTRVIKETNLLEKETFLPEGLAEILVYEIIYGKGLPPGESRFVAAVKNHEQSILNVYEKIKDDITLFPKDLKSLPQYVRVNKLHTSVSDVLKDLENSYFQIPYKENIQENEYLDLVRNLEPGQFLIDYHFKDLIVFSSEEKIYNWPLYEQGHVYIQDKSSCIPVRALNPKPGSTVVDACAAPGNKTAHMASVMKNKGVIYAFERDDDRFTTLKENLKRANVQICTPKCKDFFTVDTADEKYQSVEYVLVDPSCSGSGMVSRMDEVTDSEDSKNAKRLESLSKFQIKMLKHALRFPSAQRVVYSTCSVNEEENERVVQEVLAQFAHAYKLACVLPEWSVRGSDDYEFGHLCVRASPDVTLTNGFFVAMFEKLEDYYPRQIRGSHVSSLEHSVDKECELGSENFSERCTEEALKSSMEDFPNVESLEFPNKKKRKIKEKNLNEGASLEQCDVAKSERKQENLEKQETNLCPEEVESISNVEPFVSLNKKKRKRKEKNQNDGPAHEQSEELNYKNIEESQQKQESTECFEEISRLEVEHLSNERSSKKKHKRREKDKNDEESLVRFEKAKYESMQEDLQKLELTGCSEEVSRLEVEHLSNERSSKKKHKRREKNKNDEASLVRFEKAKYESMQEDLQELELNGCSEEVSQLEVEHLSNGRSSKKKHKRREKDKNDEASLVRFEKAKYESMQKDLQELELNGCYREVSRLEVEHLLNERSSKKKHKRTRKDENEGISHDHCEKENHVKKLKKLKKSGI